MAAGKTKEVKAFTALKEQEKESALKDLSSCLERAGYKVRRERLKQGPGWKAVSGTCRLAEGRLVFVDRKNSLDDQLLFLQSLAEKIEAA